MDDEKIIVLCDSKGCVIEAYSLVCKHRALREAERIDGYIIDVPFNPHLRIIDENLNP